MPDPSFELRIIRKTISWNRNELKSWIRLHNTEFFHTRCCCVHVQVTIYVCAPFFLILISGRSESYSFDSSALERAAKAAKELERSKFAKVYPHFFV